MIEQKTIKDFEGTDWHIYNLAKTQEKKLFYQLLSELSQIIPEIPHQGGRKPMQLRDLFFSACLKLYNGHSGRKMNYDIQEAENAKFIQKAPHYNTVSDFLNKQEVYDLLSKMLTISAMPLKELEDSFSIDSSGFGSYEKDRWIRVRFNNTKKMEWRKYLKGHVLIGTRTNCICSAEVTNGNFSDAKQAPILIDKVKDNFNIKELSADKAYSAYRIYQILDLIGATPFIPFKSNSTKEQPKAPDLWNRMFRHFKNHRESYLKRYHLRSNVEAVFSMVKLRLGEFLKSKTYIAQRNELMIKFICHNICCLVQESFESNILVDFDFCNKNYVEPCPQAQNKIFVLGEKRERNNNPLH